jgi:DNA-directed RNA polymerase subunit H (RpoH/RPB5)
MNSKQVYFKARQTILEMFRDRGYKGPYAEAAAMGANDFYHSSISSDGSINEEVDLKDFTEQRTVPKLDSGIADSGKIHAGSDKKEAVTEEIPVYVHFTTAKRPPLKDFMRTLANRNNLNRNINGNERLLGIHLLIIYDGWDYAQNKEAGELQSVYSSNEREMIGTQQPAQEDFFDTEIWAAHTLVVNYTRHVLVPEHHLLTFDEKVNEDDRKRYEAMTNASERLRFMDNYMFQVMPKIGFNDPINLYYHGRLRQIYRIVRKGKSPTYRMVRKNPLLKT